MEKTDFGTIGLKIGDVITFTRNNQNFIVTTEGGGTLVCYDKEHKPRTVFWQQYSLKCMTRWLIGDEADAVDIFELWEYEDKTLRTIHDANKKFLDVLSLKRYYWELAQ